MTGADFRRWREKRGLTALDAASVTGWSARSIQRYEAEKPFLEIPKWVPVMCVHHDNAERAKKARQGGRAT